MFSILLVLALILGVVYIKLKKFTLRGPIPGVSPYVFIGNIIELGLLYPGLSLAQALMKFKERFGDVFQYWIGPMRFISVNNANDIQYIFSHRQIYDHADFTFEKLELVFPDGMGSSRGAKYKRHALVIVPLLRRAKIIPQLNTFIDCTDKLLHLWRNQIDQQIHTDINEQCQKLLMNIFSLIAFDYDLHLLDEDKNSTAIELNLALHGILNAVRAVLYSPGWIFFLYSKLNQRYRRSRKFLKHFMNLILDQELAKNSELIQERKRISLIASFVASLQEDEIAEAMKKEEDKKGLSRNEVLNEVLGFLVAGFETTSTALSWFIHLMSKHPRVQQKLKDELLEKGDQHELTIERLDSFTYLDCVIKEVLRYNPPAEGIVRTLTADDRLPETGYQLYKGESIFIPTHNLARDKRYWKIDPDLFYPERFLTEDKDHHPMVFIPFGNGHRICAGRELAQFELKVIAARLMQYVTFGDGGPEVNSGGHLSGLTIMPKYVGVTINFD